MSAVPETSTPQPSEPFRGWEVAPPGRRPSSPSSPGFSRCSTTSCSARCCRRSPASFGWDNATASFVSTLVSVTTAVIALAVGPITDRIGRRKGMILTVSGTAVASALSSLTPSAAYLIGVRSLGGLGLSEQAVNATYLTEIYAVTDDEKIKKRRGLIYSLVQGGFPLGVLLASAWVAIFLPVIGWRGCFLLAVFPAVLIALMRRGLRESPQFELELQLRRLRKQGRAAEAAELARSYGVDERPAAPAGSDLPGPGAAQHAGARCSPGSSTRPACSCSRAGHHGAHRGQERQLHQLAGAAHRGERRGLRRLRDARIPRRPAGPSQRHRLRLDHLGDPVRAHADRCQRHDQRGHPLLARPVLLDRPVRGACCSTWASATTRPAGPRAPRSSTPCPSPARSWPEQSSRRCWRAARTGAHATLLVGAVGTFVPGSSCSVPARQPLLQG